MKNYYKELPENFKEDFVIDAKSKKTSIIFTLVSLIITAGVFVACYFLKFKDANIEYNDANFSIFWLGIIIGLIVYVVLHELIHGLFYYSFTKQKLVFGMSLVAAYCGLKEGYVNKLTALISGLAPFVIFSIVFILVIAFVPASPWLLVLAFVFASHIGGCCGDIYYAGVLLFKYNKKQVLVSDNGLKQSFYIEKN